MLESSSDEEEALLLLALVEEEHVRKRKQWVHEINVERREKGEFHTLVPQLRQNEARFYIYFRMTIESFDELLSLISEEIRKSDTNYREAISPAERLAITLRFLATGDSFYTIGHSYRVGFSTVSAIVTQVCTAICIKLENIYMPEPTTQMWEQSAEGYKNRWNFPNCIGSIDGKHITIKCPSKSGSNYWCYLYKFSIVLLAIVDPDKKFLCVDIGSFGKNSDGGVFEMSNMGRKFKANLMNVPGPRNLPGQNQPCPHVLIGDEAFSLAPYLMRPFPYTQSKDDEEKENYNKRLGNARRVVENAFGMLAQKFRIFFRPIETKVDTTILIVKTTCILHNFLLTIQCNDQFFDLLESPENEHAAFRNCINNPRRATRLAFSIRDKFVSHFNAPI